MGGEYYAKRSERSIRSKETRVGATGADLKPNSLSAPGTIPHVRGFIAIDVNPGIDAAAREVHAQESAFSASRVRIAGVGITRQV